MRLPRVRFTVGTLIFAVAVVAANCWAFRRFYETDLYRAGRITYRLLPAGLGVLPLFNVALIGTLVFAAKRLHRRCRRRAADPQTTLSAVAYFSLHFFMLGGVVCVFVPGEIQQVPVILDASTEYAARGWEVLFGEPGGTISWVISETALLGVLISGPPLLVSWIGQALATRCRATLPGHRFRALTCLVSLGFAGVALAVCLTMQPFEEEQEIALDFEVVDDVSGQPIAAAFTRITDPFSLDSPSIPRRALTDADGWARLNDRFVVVGERNAFRTLALFSPWGRWLEVSAAGHETRRIPLTEVLGSFADPARPGLRKVALARGETRADTFRDLAGMYMDGGRGFGGRWFEIEPDGRFAWCEWGCVPPASQEYGYLKRRDGAIELILVPHPGREVDPQVTVEYRAVEWGARVYLSTTDQGVLQRFCRAALTPHRPSNPQSIEGAYPRESDRDQPRTGLPRLPLKVWMTFLADEMNLSNDEGGLRLAFDSLIPRIRLR
jgi:hypothetical protein